METLVLILRAAILETRALVLYTFENHTLFQEDSLRIIAQLKGMNYGTATETCTGRTPRICFFAPARLIPGPFRDKQNDL